jgi:hypothetical protein
MTTLQLNNYIDSRLIDAARLIATNDLIEVLVPEDQSYQGVRVAFRPLILGIMDPAASDADYLSAYALADLVREGAKVVRPTTELCRVMRHVDLDIHLRDYAQPFPSMGFVIPGGLIGQRQDALSVALWLPDHGLHVVCFLKRGDQLIYCTTGVHNSGTLEESLRYHDRDRDDAAHAWTADDEDLCSTVARISLNLGLFAAEKGVQVRPLDTRAERRRRRSSGDERMARLASRDAREVVIRDVDLIVRAGRGGVRGPSRGCWRQPAHVRRGHWRMQPVGPGRVATRRVWVSPYWVGLGDGEWPPSHITTVLS